MSNKIVNKILASDKSYARQVGLAKHFILPMLVTAVFNLGLIWGGKVKTGLAFSLAIGVGIPLSIVIFYLIKIHIYKKRYYTEALKINYVLNQLAGTSSIGLKFNSNFESVPGIVNLTNSLIESDAVFNSITTSKIKDKLIPEYIKLLQPYSNSNTISDRLVKYLDIQAEIERKALYEASKTSLKDIAVDLELEDILNRLK